MATHQTPDPVYILGAGAIGFPLAAQLVAAGRSVLAVRTSQDDLPPSTVTVSVQNGDHQLQAEVETVALARLPRLRGTIVIASKAYANGAIARALKERAADGPIVLLQNGLGVEQPLLDAQFAAVYRCILYVTSQTVGEYAFATRPVAPSPIGVVRGSEAGLRACVAALHTEGLPFRAEPRIEREVWRKTIINAAFNSICPLLDIDNGVFARDEAAARLAAEIVRECVALTDRLDLELDEQDLLEQILLISKRSDGQLISTLQDIRAGRPTEIDFLNLAIARVAASMQPALAVPRVELLGRLVALRTARR